MMVSKTGKRLPPVRAQRREGRTERIKMSKPWKT
jgi:hypothetical protein